MMKVKGSVLGLALFVCVQMAFSQNPHHILVRAGEEASKKIPYQEQFHYKDFRVGQLYYPHSKRSETMRLNYNLLLGGIQFINDRGDTLLLKKNENIFKYVRIGGDLYHHDLTEGYFMLLTREPKVQLGVQRLWKVVRRDAVMNNGYGTITSAAGGFTAIRSEETSAFVQYEDHVYAKYNSYFLITFDDKLFKATKAGFSKMFQDYRDELRGYLKKNDVDFQNENDLKQLLEYCLALSKV